MQSSGISKPTPIHIMLLSFPSQQPNQWNRSIIDCACLKQDGIAWSCFGTRYKHGEPTELTGLPFLQKPWGLIRIDHSSFKISHSSLWVIPQHICHISFHAKEEPGKHKNEITQLTSSVVNIFLCFKICVLLLLLHSDASCLLILSVGSSRLSWHKFSVTCIPGWGRKGEREVREGRLVCIQTIGLHKAVLNLTIKVWFLWKESKWCVRKRETQDDIG